MPTILIGYSGHALVAADILQLMGHTLLGYCDHEEKALNPLGIPYLGPEAQALAQLERNPYFISIGHNRIRAKVGEELLRVTGKSAVAIQHPSAIVAGTASIGPGSMLAARAVVNPYAEIGEGAILNTGCIVEHECQVGAYAHIAPGAVLAGNVTVGEQAFVGAGAVVKQGITIGADAIIGAGAVVIRDVEAGVTVVGNPAKPL